MCLLRNMRIITLLLLLLINAGLFANSLAFGEAPSKEDVLDKNFVCLEGDSGIRRIYFDNEKKVLTQKMFEDNNGNPIINAHFIIRSDYKLVEDINIPYNSTLEFDGGIIGGKYKINGNNTAIVAPTRKIFSTEVTLTGSWKISEIYPEWFGAIGDYNETTKKGTDNSAVFQHIINLTDNYFNGYSIKLCGQYLLSSTIVVKKDLSIIGGHCIYNRFSDGKNTDKTSIPSSPSMLIIGGDFGFYLNGKRDGVLGCDYSSIHLSNIKVVGLDVNKNSFLKVTGAGAPSRVSVIKECEFTNLNRVLFVDVSQTKKSSVLGNLTISECYAHSNQKFICSENNKKEETVAFTNLLLENSTIEGHKSSNCILLAGVSSSVIIRNNILESQACPINIRVRRGFVEISHNYFEQNHLKYGPQITVESVLLPNDGRAISSLRLFGNYASSSSERIEVNIKNMDIVEADFSSLHPQSVFNKCFISCSNNQFNYEWIADDSFCLFRDFDCSGGKYLEDQENSNTPNSCTICGYYLATPLRNKNRPGVYKSSKPLNDANANIFITALLYDDTVTSFNSYIKVGNSDSSKDITSLESVSLYNKKNYVVVWKTKAKKPGEIYFYINNTSAPTKSGSVAGVNIHFGNINNKIITVPTIETPIVCSTKNRPKAWVINKGYKCFDETLNIPIYWDGIQWKEEDTAVAGVRRSGNFSQKPSPNDIYVGFQYFNTDNNKVIVWGGKKWYYTDGMEAAE